MAAAAVEMREPLVPLYSLNSKDLGHHSPALGKLSQRPKGLRKTASLGPSRATSEAKAEFIAEAFESRPSPDPIAEDPNPAMEISHPLSRTVEKQGEFGMSTSYGHDDHDQRDEGAAGDEQESKSLMQLKMEAMTWAAMAKDYTISSLERRLRQALEIAKAEQDRNEELGRLLRESKEREVATALELKDAKEQIGQLIDAEERLCVQLGDLEAEAVEEDRRYRSQIAALTARIEAQDKFIAEVLKPFKAGQSPSYLNTSEKQFLFEKLEMAKKEIASLQADLDDAKTDLRVADGLRKSQSRKLKALEKERRYLMRKGAIRSIRLAPRSHKKSEIAAPGGEGWKVFSILDFQA
ncbi:unnamed protein product [Calypogeia fissa]